VREVQTGYEWSKWLLVLADAQNLGTRSMEFYHKEKVERTV